MCGLSYSCVACTLLVVPLAVCSVVNVFLAGPPLKTVSACAFQHRLLGAKLVCPSRRPQVVLSSNGGRYSASLPLVPSKQEILRLRASDGTARLTLLPEGEMTRFLLLTLYAEERTRSYEATALGMAAHGTLVPLAHSTARMGAASAELPVLQLPVLLQGYSEYELTVRSKGAERDPPPQLEFRRACAGCRSLPVSLPPSSLSLSLSLPLPLPLPLPL